MYYHWRSSDAKELFEKTVLRRVSLVVLVVLSLSSTSTGRLVIDQHCLHGQYHSLFTNTTTCSQSSCSGVIGPDRQPYTITQEELPSANVLLLGYSISFWIKVDTAENYTNRHLISLTDSRGKHLWKISINGINVRRKSRMISMLIKSELNHSPNNLLSVRLSTSQKETGTWHNALFSFHSNGQITPYFDGFEGEHQWVPVVNIGAHHIILGGDQKRHKFNLQYKDPYVFTRPLSEADAIALQQSHPLTDEATVYPHCLCPEGYTLSLINQYFCTSDSSDHDILRIKDDSVSITLWQQHGSKRLKRNEGDDDGSGSGMDTSVIVSTLLMSISGSIFPSESVTFMTSTFSTFGMTVSGDFSTTFSSSEFTSSIPFTSIPSSSISPLPTPQTISSPVDIETSTIGLLTTEVSISSATINSTTSSMDITPSFSSTILSVSPFSFTPSTVRNSTSDVFSTIEMTSIFFSSTISITTSMILSSNITPLPSFTMTITDTIVPSSINITSAVILTSFSREITNQSSFSTFVVPSETIVSTVSTSRTVISTFTVPTMITTGSVSELTSIPPLPTPSVLSSTTSVESVTLTRPFTMLPTAPNSEFLSPSVVTTFSMNTSQPIIPFTLSSTETAVTTSLSMIPRTNFTSTTFVSPTDTTMISLSSFTGITTVMVTLDELTPTTTPSLSSSLMTSTVEIVSSTTEIVTTIITSVIPSEILSSSFVTLNTVDITSSFEPTVATMTTSPSISEVSSPSSLVPTPESDSTMTTGPTFTTMTTSPIFTTMTNSGIVNSMSEISSPSSLVPTPESDSTMTTGPTFTTMTTSPIFTTMTNSGIVNSMSEISSPSSLVPTPESDSTMTTGPTFTTMTTSPIFTTMTTSPIFTTMTNSGIVNSMSEISSPSSLVPTPESDSTMTTSPTFTTMTTSPTFTTMTTSPTFTTMTTSPTFTTMTTSPIFTTMTNSGIVNSMSEISSPSSLVPTPESDSTMTTGPTFTTMTTSPIFTTMTTSPTFTTMTTGPTFTTMTTSPIFTTMTNSGIVNSMSEISSPSSLVPTPESDSTMTTGPTFTTMTTSPIFTTMTNSGIVNSMSEISSPSSLVPTPESDSTMTTGPTFTTMTTSPIFTTMTNSGIVNSMSKISSPSSLVPTPESDSTMTTGPTFITMTTSPIFITMTNSGIVNSLSELSSPSNLVPTPETEFTMTINSMISSTASSTGLFSTMMSSNIITTDFTSTSSSTFSSEADMSTTFIPQSSSRVRVSTTETVLSSSAISETPAPNSVLTLSTIESTQPTSISSSLTLNTEILSTIASESIIESTNTLTASSSPMFLTSSPVIDIASSVVVSPTLRPIPVMPSDSINVTMSTVPSFNQPITSMISTSIRPSISPSPSSEFITSETSAELLPTPTPIVSSEVNPSATLLSTEPSSPVVSVASFTTALSSPLVIPTATPLEVSPTPTMLQCSPGTELCEILMTCIPTTQECPNIPRAPIAVLVERGTFLIDEIKQDENKTNQYTFRFVNINAYTEGAIVSKLGSLEESETFVSPSQINYSSLEGHIIENKIAPNDTIYIVIQAHNLSILSTSRESFSVVITRNDTNLQDECTIAVKSGYCIASLNGFNSPSTVSISVMEKNNLQSRVSLDPIVEVIEIAESNVNGPAILMKLPTYTIYPPDDVIITIISINYSVKSLLMNCTVNDSDASITALPIKNWSTLFINNNIENQLAISHERVMEAMDEDEEEILSMKINFKDYKTDRIEVQCQLEELLLTNRVLVDTEDLNIRVLDRNNVKNSSGYIFLANDTVAYLIAYSNQTVVFNTAVINGKRLTYTLVAEGVTMTGRVENLTNLHCISSNSNVLKVTSNCSEVFLDGAEIMGSESVAINVHYGSLNTVVLFRVWHPKMLVLEAEDLVLNAISNWHDPHLNCSRRYQQTVFRVFANVTDGARTKYKVDVTSIVSEILRSSDESVIRVFPNATVQGVSPGTATIIANNINLIQFNVSNETVKAAALEVMLYNKLNVTIPRTIDLYNEANGTVMLTQESDRAKVVFVNLLLTDSQRMELKQSDYVVDIKCSDNIALRNNLIYPIGNTNGSKECIRVTLIRDKACNVSDSVEGVANVSVQLSTPDYLEINLSSHEIIADKNISVITGIRTEITLQAILYFRNGDQIDITLSNETNITTALNITRSLESLMLSASPGHTDSEYTINVTNSLYNVSNSITVNIVQDIAINLSIHPYPVYNNSERTNITRLSRIGNTKRYQQGLLKVVLALPNRKYNITANASFMFSDDALMLSNGTVRTVTVNSDIMVPINVSITARFSSLSSEYMIQVTPNPVQLVNIDVSFVPEFTGVQNSIMHVNAGVTLSDDTTIPNIYNGNISLYPGLLNFSVSDITTASIEGNAVKLLGNSLTDNYITAIAQNATTERFRFRCNLEAGLHDVDLGNNLNLPITVDTGSKLKIPVHVNSENTTLGIFEINVMYPSKELEVIDVVPGEDWVTGSLAYQIVTVDDDIDMVNFGGINYQSTKGKSIHVASITFEANSSGNVILNSTIPLLAGADFESTLLAARNRNSMAGSLFTIDINANRKRRDISHDEPPLMGPDAEIHHHHHKRQNNENPQELVGDANLDGIVDLRDVNYLRHYQVESVYNFTSSNGMTIQSQTFGMFSTLDVNGDGQINGLDTIELENINFDLLRVIDNINASCFSDNGICTCSITGELYTNDMQPSPVHDVFILVDFGSTNQSFQNEFNNTYFENGSHVSYHNVQGLYGGIVLAELKNNSNRTVFVVKTNSSFNTPNIGISLVQVTIDANSETSDDRKSVHVASGSSYPALNVSVSIPNISGEISIILDNGYSPFRILSNDCPIATTLSTLSTFNLVTTTMVSSALVTTSTLSPTSIIASSEVPTSTTMVMSISLTAEQPAPTSNSIAATSSVQPTSTTVAVFGSSIATLSVQLTPTTVASNSSMTPTTVASNSSMTPTTVASNSSMTPTTVGSSSSMTPTTVTSNSSTDEQSTPATAEQTKSTTTVSTTLLATTLSEKTTSTTMASSSLTTQQPTVITTTGTPSTSTPTGITETSSGGGSSIGVVVAVVVILVVVITVVVVVIAGCCYRRSKRRNSYYFKPNSRPSSGLSSNYWFQEEEKIEMSPIDIVPMAPSPCDEQFRDTLTVPVANGIGFHNNGYVSGTQRSADGGTKPAAYFKPSTESSAGPPPPLYNSRHQRIRPESTAFDDEVNLSFHDELISQPYLSLGLTPLSQLSPPDNQDVGFFPSLPPPVTTAVDDHSKYSIPVDGPLFNERPTKKNRKAGLETVPEQSTSPSSRYSQGSSQILSPFQRNTQPDESFVFPSANISQDYLRTLSSGNNRLPSSNYGARNQGYSSQYEEDPLIDFDEYGSGFSIHVDSSPESKRNGRSLNYHSATKDSSPDSAQQQFTRRGGGRIGVKRSRGDLSSQRSSQEMMLRQPRKERDYVNDLDSILIPRPISPPGVYPPQMSDIPNNFTPPVKDGQNFGSISSIPSYREDNHASTLL